MVPKNGASSDIYGTESAICGVKRKLDTAIIEIPTWHSLCIVFVVKMASSPPAPKIIAVMGPTCSGKSEFAESLADRLEAQLVNADAFQVYKYFDIGTNKPDDRDRYEMLDICEPDEQFSVGEFAQRVIPILERCFSRGQSVVLTGGTGLYIRAVMDEYADLMPAPDEELRASIAEIEAEFGLGALRERIEALDPQRKVDWENPVRVRRALERLLDTRPAIRICIPPFEKHKFGMDLETETLNSRIDERTPLLFEKGWRAEVEELMRKGIPADAPPMRAIGYFEITQLISGTITYEECVLQINRLTKQYAKRQRSWLRSESDLRWIQVEDLSEMLSEAGTFF